MGAQSSRTYHGRGGSEAFLPLVLGEIINGDPRQALRGSDDDVCAVCIGQLACAPTHSLRQCNHRFHALCLACALQAQQLCPMCRTEVPTEECNKLADELFADASSVFADASSAHLAYELLMERKVEDDSIAAEERIIEKIRRDAEAGDDTRIPIFAALLGQGGNHTPQKASRSAAVRVAAVEGLRKLVPAFPREWIGYPRIVVLLQCVSLEEKDSEVRSAALFALREIASKGDQELMSSLRVVVEGSKADSDVRLASANAIQGLAERGNLSAAWAAAIGALTDRDPAVRSVGLTALQACCARGVGLELIEGIVDVATNFPETGVRTNALGLLGEVEAAATQCLEDKDEQVQSAALVALRQMWKRGDAEAVSTLASLAMGAMGPPGGSHRLQMEALDALPRVAIRPNAPAAGAAATMLGCEDSTLRRTAATVLPQLCNKGDATVLMQVLGYVENHPNVEARRDAIEVLGNIATRDSTAVKAVLKRLSEASTDDELQLVAESALRRIG